MRECLGMYNFYAEKIQFPGLTPTFQQFYVKRVEFTDEKEMGKQIFQVIGVMHNDRLWDYGEEVIFVSTFFKGNGGTIFDKERTHKEFFKSLKERAELMLIDEYKELEFITVRDKYSAKFIKDRYTFKWNPHKLNLGIKEIFLSKVE